MTIMISTRDVYRYCDRRCELVFPWMMSRGANAVGPRTRTNQAKSKTMKKTPSGLQYLDEKEGDRRITREPGQNCLVHYTGWLWENNAKGKEFDSSQKRNAPFMFPVGEGQVIKGWDEGVATMKVRRQARLLIPPALGYGRAAPAV